MRYGPSAQDFNADVSCDVEVQSTPAKPDKINAGAFLFYAGGGDLFLFNHIQYRACHARLIV